jgi:hypothetical protein
MTEEERYALINGQMKELLDKAATDLNPATNMLRAMLYAEMYCRNELTHMQVMEVRTAFVGTLWGLIAKWRVQR